MDNILFERMSEVLGWRPEANDEASVTDLNAFPATLIEAARQLDPVLAQGFVRYFASTDNLEFIPGFIEDVVEHGEEVSGWRRGRILVPGFLPRSLVQLEVEKIIAPLVPAAGETWYHLRPRRDYWDAGEFLNGAPAVIRPNLNYRYFPSENVRDLLMPGTELNRDVDLKIATRRWTASTLARAAMSRNLLSIREAIKLLRACFPDANQLSTNGLVAARGLIQELSCLPENNAEVPGFRGPDDWYQDQVDVR